MFLERTNFVKRMTALFERVAPVAYADKSWDNVGLIYESLVEPENSPLVLMTIDVTEQVIKEAIEKKASMVLSYHPPWFRSAKQLHLEALPVVTIAASNGISLYAMHSSLDAMPNGVNDWLLKAIFGVEHGQQISEEQTMGRVVDLSAEISLEEVIEKAKNVFKLKHIRVARSPKASENIRRVAVCAGSGSSVLRDVSADLYVCGEMSHHDLLYSISHGTHVILGEHTNTERGYLSMLKLKLELEAAALEPKNTFPIFEISQVDADPIKIR